MDFELRFRRLFFTQFCWSLFYIALCDSQEDPYFSFSKDATTAPSLSYYDYIIIGGGTSGCPLAATLSKRAKVLLLERGGSPYGNSNITRLENFGNPIADTSPSSPSQRFVSEDGVINARARVLGGGSSINAGFYSRASMDYVREAGWNEKMVNKSYRWVEYKVAFEPQIGEWQSAVMNGLLEVGVQPFHGFTYDHLVGTKIGGTIFDSDGRRHTAANLLEYANPHRLTVLLRATVCKILFKAGESKRPAARGVIFKDSTGVERRAYLRDGSLNEIIVASGALGSPQILMLSGIGPARHLIDNNIPVVLDQPSVGQFMADNPMNAIFVPSPVLVDVSLIQVVGITNFGSYIEAAGGANFGRRTTSSRDYGLFSPKIGQLGIIPPKMRTPEAIARAIKLMESLDEAAFRGGFILEKVMGPLSRGHLELRTLSPDDNPSVTFNYFQNPVDLQRCVQGLTMIERVIQSRAFSKFTTTRAPINMRPRGINHTVTLEQYCRDTVMTIWHYHGGCLVGSVVDKNYKVLGVDALRVIDGSTFNMSPGTNPQATVMMLGRYMGQKILSERVA